MADHIVALFLVGARINGRCGSVVEIDRAHASGVNGHHMGANIALEYLLLGQRGLAQSPPPGVGDSSPLIHGSAGHTQCSGYRADGAHEPNSEAA